MILNRELYGKNFQPFELYQQYVITDLLDKLHFKIHCSKLEVGVRKQNRSQRSKKHQLENRKQHKQ